MKRSFKVLLYILIGAVVLLAATLCVLLCLGFRFTPEAAVPELYRRNTHIHTDEYDFYLHDVANENDVPAYADGHEAVKKYGFLYKRIDSDEKHSDLLVAENGESVGHMYSYEGALQTYRFIHWTAYSIPADEQPELEVDDDTAAAAVNVKYRSDNIVYNGTKKELFRFCYFVTDETFESMVIKDTNVYIK